MAVFTAYLTFYDRCVLGKNVIYIALIIVPLKTLIREHVRRCQQHNISAVALVTDDEMSNAEIAGN